MSTPNRIVMSFDGGTAAIFGDIFADMLTTYYLALHARQKAAQDSLAAIKLGDEDRKSQFAQAAFNYDDAESRMQIVDQIEKVFKNRAVELKHYEQPAPRDPHQA